MYEIMLPMQSACGTGHNSTGPPCSVGFPRARPPVHQSSPSPAAGRPAGPHAGSVTDDDRRQPAKQYWRIRQASNKNSARVIGGGGGISPTAVVDHHVIHGVEGLGAIGASVMSPHCLFLSLTTE